MQSLLYLLYIVILVIVYYEHEINEFLSRGFSILIIYLGIELSVNSNIVTRYYYLKKYVDIGYQLRDTL